MVKVVTPRVIAGSAFVRPTIVQHKTRHPQHAGSVAAVRRADGDAPLTGAVPQLPEGVDPTDLRVPPLDFWGGVSHHVAVQLEGVARELGLRQRGFHEARWRARFGDGRRREGQMRANERESKTRTDGRNKSKEQPDEDTQT